MDAGDHAVVDFFRDSFYLAGIGTDRASQIISWNYNNPHASNVDRLAHMMQLGLTDAQCELLEKRYRVGRLKFT